MDLHGVIQQKDCYTESEEIMLRFSLSNGFCENFFCHAINFFVPLSNFFILLFCFLSNRYYKNEKFEEKHFSHEIQNFKR
jgi:hypothetical protein